MYGIVLVTHGPLAYGFVEAAKLIVGNFEIEYIGLKQGADLEEFEKEVEKKILSAKKKHGDLIVISDLIYGTPFNTIVRLMEKIDMVHISGINLPVLLEIITARESNDVITIRERILKMAGSTIVYVNQLLENEVEV